jgi:hypothetical protein
LSFTSTTARTPNSSACHRTTAGLTEAQLS